MTVFLFYETYIFNSARTFCENGISKLYSFFFDSSRNKIHIECSYFCDDLGYPFENDRGRRRRRRKCMIDFVKRVANFYFFEIQPLWQINNSKGRFEINYHTLCNAGKLNSFEEREGKRVREWGKRGRWKAREYH